MVTYMLSFDGVYDGVTRTQLSTCFQTRRGIERDGESLEESARLAVLILLKRISPLIK